MRKVFKYFDYLLECFPILSRKDNNQISPVNQESNFYRNQRGINKSNSFHSEFLQFQHSLGFRKPLRKLRIDSVLKKCKSKMFKAVQEAVNLLLNLNCKVNRLPQEFITNININYNKRYLDKSLSFIYEEFKLISKIEENIWDQKIEEKKKLLGRLLQMTYRQAYQAFLNSERFKIDLISMVKREGGKYARLYNYVCQIFIPYFQLGKGNITKKNSLNLSFEMGTEYETDANHFCSQNIFN
jgi:hypothetical protein